jgi:hypothetical protein
MNEYLLPPDDGQAALLSRAELMRTVTSIPYAGMWDPGGATKEKIRVLALDAVNDPRLQVRLTETGCPEYGAYLTNMDLPQDDLTRGKLALCFCAEDFAFSGISVDLRPFNKGRYNLQPDGQLAVCGDGEQKKLHPVRARLLFGVVRNLCVTFTDPTLLAAAEEN